MVHCKAVLSAICFSALATSAHGQAIGSASTPTSKPGAIVTIPGSFSESVPGTGKPGLGSPPLPIEPFGSTSTTSSGALGASPGRLAAQTGGVIKVNPPATARSGTVAAPGASGSRPITFSATGQHVPSGAGGHVSGGATIGSSNTGCGSPGAGFGVDLSSECMR